MKEDLLSTNIEFSVHVLLFQSLYDKNKNEKDSYLDSLSFPHLNNSIIIYFLNPRVALLNDIRGLICHPFLKDELNYNSIY